MRDGLNFIDYFYVVLPWGYHRDSAHRREARRIIRRGLSEEQREELKRIRFDKAHRGYKTLPLSSGSE
jgi:hypothetical protein